MALKVVTMVNLSSLVRCIYRLGYYTHASCVWAVYIVLEANVELTTWSLILAVPKVFILGCYFVAVQLTFALPNLY